MQKLTRLQRRLAAVAIFASRPANVVFAPGLSAALILTCCWLSACDCNATIVRFQTSLGNIDVRLYNAATPLSVANFLAYSNANRYDGTFIHRNPPGFVVQGGGFEFAPPNIVNPVVDPADPDDPVLNEPGISNQRGTIAMAKLGGNPNSATSQWFFNLKDNSGPPPALDTVNGGFTVFGRVILNGMSIVDAIDLLPLADLDGGGGSTFDEVPLRGASGDPLANRLVFIDTVDVRNFPAGDYNFDGTVNIADYSIWKTDFGSTIKAEADGNGNGRVDAADYTIWRNTFGQTSVPGSGAGEIGALGVPEPGSMMLAAIAGGILALAARCRGKF